MSSGFQSDRDFGAQADPFAAGGSSDNIFGDKLDGSYSASLADSEASFCKTSTDCASGFVCIGGKCVDRSGFLQTSDSGCGNAVDNGGSSTTGGCIDSGCIDPSSPNNGVVICRPNDEGQIICETKEKCEGDAECCVGGICVEGKCQPQECSYLTEFENCEFGYSCIDGRCIPGPQVSDPQCPPGTALRNGECKGLCTSFCDSYKKTHGTRGPGCFDYQECDACNECGESGTCVDLKENAPCWCVCSQDAPFCYDCAMDGASELNCKDCETCSEIPGYICPCGAELPELKICRNACEGPTRITMEEVMEEAAKSCTELCQTDTRCSDLCAEQTYEGVLPACPQGLICGELTKSGGVPARQIVLGQWKRLIDDDPWCYEVNGETLCEWFPKAGELFTSGPLPYDSEIKITAKRLSDGKRVTVPWTPSSSLNINSSADDFDTRFNFYQESSWKGGVIAVTIHKTNSYYYVDPDCAKEQCPGSEYCGETDMAPKNHPCNSYFFNDQSTIYEVVVGGRRQGNFVNDMTRFNNADHEANHPDPEGRTGTSMFYPYLPDQGIVRAWSGLTAKIPTEFYDIETVEIEHKRSGDGSGCLNGECYSWDHTTGGTLSAATGEVSPIRYKRKECELEGLSEQCLDKLKFDRSLAISVIDEDDGYRSEEEKAQDSLEFQTKFPGRKLLVLVPGRHDEENGQYVKSFRGPYPTEDGTTEESVGTFSGTVVLPADFRNYGTAWVVPRSGENTEDDPDKYDDSPYPRPLTRKRGRTTLLIDYIKQGVNHVDIWLDRSGSMTPATIEPDLRKTERYFIRKNISYRIFDDFNGENWIRPHIDFGLESGVGSTSFCNLPGDRVQVRTMLKGSTEASTVIDATDVERAQYKIHRCTGGGGQMFWRVVVQGVPFSESGGGESRLMKSPVVTSDQYVKPYFVTLRQNGAGEWEEIDSLTCGINEVEAEVKEKDNAPMICTLVPIKQNSDFVSPNGSPGSQPSYSTGWIVKRLADGSYQVRGLLNGTEVLNQTFSAGEWKVASLSFKRYEDGDFSQKELDRFNSWRAAATGAGSSLADIVAAHPDKPNQILSPGVPEFEAFGIKTLPSTVPSDHYSGGGQPIPEGEHYFDWFSSSAYGPLADWQAPNSVGDGELSDELEKGGTVRYGAQGFYKMVFSELGYEQGLEIASGEDEDEVMSRCRTIDDIGGVIWAAKCSSTPRYSYEKDRGQSSDPAADPDAFD